MAVKKAVQSDYDSIISYKAIVLFFMGHYILLMCASSFVSSFVWLQITLTGFMFLLISALLGYVSYISLFAS
jgi:hypothetical protein